MKAEVAKPNFEQISCFRSKSEFSLAFAIQSKTVR